MALQNLPPVAIEYAAKQRRENAAAVAAVRRLWLRVGDDFTPGFLNVAPQIFEVMNTAQVRISENAQTFIPQILAATDQAKYDRPTFDVKATAFMGVAGDGLPTESLAYGAVIRAKDAVGKGSTALQARVAGANYLSLAVGTMLSDTRRGMEGLESASRPITGYVRMLTPPSCGRCVILAGKRSKRSQAFLRHPGCFPAGAVVSGPAPEAATRRWYEGELAIIRTASGKKLTATANHPILTDQGWIPAGLLNKGDRVLTSTSSDGAIPLVVPDEKQAPTLIEDVWGSDDMVPLGKMPTAPEDFHGDGGHGDVDVVLPNRLLGHGSHVGGVESIIDRLLAAGLNLPTSLSGLGSGDELVPVQADASRGPMGGGGLGLALLRGHLGGPDFSGIGSASDLTSGTDEMAADHVSTDALTVGEFVLADTGFVVAHDGGAVEHHNAPRWDAPAGPLSVETRGAYASRGKDLGLRLSGQVEVDRVVDVELIQWSGHVYNLTASEGWYAADGFIVSNCDCINIPSAESIAGDLTVNTDAYFGSLSDDELAKALGSKANAEAYVKYGTDPYQTVNAYRKKLVIGPDGSKRYVGGVRPAQITRQVIRNGQPILENIAVKATTEGTTARSYAYSQMSRVRALSASAKNGGKYRTVTAARLMPESILSLGLSRERTAQMLRDFGWI